MEIVLAGTVTLFWSLFTQLALHQVVNFMDVLILYVVCLMYFREIN